ncbi:Rv3235 family protein [Micromonospora sonneratiae]|uniref:Rv3235 family protein n=1 Tax=Micromonospora sonneratiae TaxID=1184706 RepID=UPI00366B27A7
MRLRAIPPLDPPFDDESSPSVWPPVPYGQLMFELTPGRGRNDRTRPPGRPPALPPGGLVTASPEAKRAMHRFLNTCLEILNGYRPAAQIRPLTSPVNTKEIVAQLAAGIERLTPARRTTGRPADPVRIRRVRLCEPRTGVVEAAAVLDTPARSWAMAFRLERLGGNWVGTVAQLL